MWRYFVVGTVLALGAALVLVTGLFLGAVIHFLLFK